MVCRGVMRWIAGAGGGSREWAAVVEGSVLAVAMVGWGAAGMWAGRWHWHVLTVWWHAQQW